MFKSISTILTTSLSRALCIPRTSTRALSSSSYRQPIEKASRSSSTSISPSISPSQNFTAYTVTDAAEFSRQGASITALPPDETVPITQACLSPVTTLHCERLGEVVKADREETREVYTSCHAAEFMRRGACMAVWPGEEGDATVDAGSPTGHGWVYELGKAGSRSKE